jgi:CelD/BcsL family acetyltransferase involved in cellulose biosynthesis
MEVVSPLTGRRGVSLPFTDLCPLLAADEESAHQLLDQALVLGRERGWRYLELRGLPSALRDLSPSVTFLSHELDLRKGLEALEAGLDPSVRRAIRKAEQAGVEIEFTHSAQAMQTYFRLHSLTRKRHGLPPQPARFFDVLGQQAIATGSGFIAIARWMGQPVAGAIFLHSGRRAIYKYGASDDAFQNLRPNNLLFWAAIRECDRLGVESLHFGRSSAGNEGLCRFKRSFGAVEKPLLYARYHFGRAAWVRTPDRAQGPANGLFRLLPLGMLRGLGRLLYPHLS